MEHKHMGHHRMAEKIAIHHKEREMHRKAHHARMDDMHKGAVKEDHQEGIKRVMQRKGDMPVGQGGKLVCW